ncbi:MAG: hypothetical protein V4596_02430 [Bdellovibrionota bacterium]
MKVLFSVLLLFSIETQARVFNITESSFATYFKGSYGLSNIKKDPYGKSSGAQTEFSDSVDFNWGGEIGFVFPSKDYSFKVGMAIIAPHSPSGIKGKDSGGAELMSLDSSVYGFFPVAHFEYYVAKNNFGRTYISFGGGYGKVSLKNDYTLTAAGDALYSTPNSFSEKSSQYTYLIETSVGYEMSFVQAVTVTFDLGYRYSAARKLKYDGAGDDFSDGHAEGDQVLDSDGKSKTLDLGGVFTGLSFRFYFN